MFGQQYDPVVGPLEYEDSFVLVLEHDPKLEVPQVEYEDKVGLPIDADSMLGLESPKAPKLEEQLLLL